MLTHSLTKKLFVLTSLISTILSPLSATTPASNIADNLPTSPLTPLPPLPPKTKPTPSPALQPIKRIQEKLVKEDATYFHPGLLILRGDRWDGGDYLYNLTDQIGVYLSILEPEEKSANLDQKTILQNIFNQFNRSGIKPGIVVKEGSPPLPFFHIQVLVYPVGTRYAASCKGTLFEEVSLKRVELDPSTVFQAITWQRESLIVISSDNFESQLNKSISETVSAFIERFQFYRELKSTSRSYNE
jgi:hypothetical protein